MEAKQIKKLLNFRTRLRRLFLLIIQKISGKGGSMAIIFFYGKNMEIFRLNKSRNVVSIAKCKSINLPADIYDYRRAMISDVKKMVSFLKSEVAGVKRDLFVKNAIIILPNEVIFSKLIAVDSLKDSLIKEKIRQFAYDKENDDVVKWRHVNPMDDKGIDHLDVYAESVDGVVAKNIYTAILSGLKAVPTMFLSEAEAIVSYLFPSEESRDANLIIKIDNNRTLFIVFAGRAIQFSSIDFLGCADFEKDEGCINDFVERVKSMVDFYKNQNLHEHGASSSINKIILADPSPVKSVLIDRLALSIKLKIEQLRVPDSFTLSRNKLVLKIEIPQDLDHPKRMELLPVLGSLRIINKLF